MSFMRWVLSLFLLVVIARECYSFDRFQRDDYFSRSLSGQGYLPLSQDIRAEGNLREDISRSLSPGLSTKTTLYPLHSNLEQNVREVLNILSSDRDERQKVEALNLLVQRALPELLEELRVPLNSDDLVGILSRSDVTSQQLRDHFKERKQREKIFLQKAQARLVLNAISELTTSVGEIERDDLADYNVFSTLHSDIIRGVERVLGTHNVENLDDFGLAIDRGVFAKKSRRVCFSSLPFGLIGLIPSSPSCGYLMSNAATFLKFPPDHPSASVMIAYILAATTPAFVHQFFDVGISLTSSLFQEVPFVKKKDENGINPHRFQRNIFHKGVNVLLAGNAFVTALFPTLLMKGDEIQFSAFFGITVAPFFIAWFDNALQGGIVNADRIFRRYFYTTPQTEVIKKILRQELRTFVSEIKKNKGLARRISVQIEERRNEGFSRNENDPFLFSCFFVKSISQSATYLSEVDIQKPVMSKDSALWLSTILTGMGSYGRYTLFQSVFEELVGSMGFSPLWTSAISIGFALGETLYRNLCSHAQEEFFLNGAGLFSSEKNLTVWRKTASALSCISGVLFSIPGLVAGLNIFENYSTIDKIAILAPAVLLDYSSYQPFFKLYYDSIINHFAARFGCYNTNHLAKLVYYAEEVDKFIVNADVPTTANLWKILKEKKVPHANVRDLNGG